MLSNRYEIRDGDQISVAEKTILFNIHVLLFLFLVGYRIYLELRMVFVYLSMHNTIVKVKCR